MEKGTSNGNTVKIQKLIDDCVNRFFSNTDQRESSHFYKGKYYTLKIIYKGFKHGIWRKNVIGKFLPLIYSFSQGMMNLESSSHNLSFLNDSVSDGKHKEYDKNKADIKYVYMLKIKNIIGKLIILFII